MPQRAQIAGTSGGTMALTAADLPVNTASLATPAITPLCSRDSSICRQRGVRYARPAQEGEAGRFAGRSIAQLIYTVRCNRLSVYVMGKAKNKRPLADPAPTAANPTFAGLEQLRGTLPPGADRPEDPAPSTQRFAAKVVVRRERSGRGGKTVTVINGVLLEGAEREALLRELRKSLGTSGQFEGDCLVLGGDVRQRVASWLEKAGAAKVVIGN